LEILQFRDSEVDLIAETDFLIHLIPERVAVLDFVDSDASSLDIETNCRGAPSTTIKVLARSIHSWAIGAISTE